MQNRISKTSSNSKAVDIFFALSSQSSYRQNSRVYFWPDLSLVQYSSRGQIGEIEEKKDLVNFPKVKDLPV